jgi:hypothetical protein
MAAAIGQSRSSLVPDAAVSGPALLSGSQTEQWPAPSV